MNSHSASLNEAAPLRPGGTIEDGERGTLEPADSLCLRPLRAIDHGELHNLSLLQRLVAIRLDGRVMNENVWAARLLDKPIALGVAEPFDLALCCDHGCVSSKCDSSYSACNLPSLSGDRPDAKIERASAQPRPASNRSRIGYP